MRDYPKTPSLEDNTAIAQLVKSGKEKGRGAGDDPFSAMKPSSVAGRVGAEGAEKKKEESEKPKDSSKSKKGFFGLF